jgi:hypothetical protein
MPVPRCSALRRDGSPCTTLASSPDATYCAHHERLVEVHGEDAVRNGTYPKKRNPKAESVIAVEPAKNISEATNGTNGTVALAPSDVRPSLARAAAASLDEIQQALLDAALGAVREHWATFQCPDCGKKHRAQVSVPDVRSRVAAIELLLREGLGRPAQAEESSVPQLPDSAEAVKAMSWTDLQTVFAVTFANEIEAVSERGTGALRERVAALSEGERGMLREALDEVEAAA